MSRSIVSRSFAMVMAIVVAMAFSFLPAENTYAASKKTVYRAVSSTTVYQYSSDSTPFKSTTKNTYDKRGLLKKSVYTESDSDSEKSIYKRNKKGACTSEKVYKGKELVREVKYKLNKKGLPTKISTYSYPNTVNTLTAVTTYTYYSNGKVKKRVFKDKEHGNTYTVTNRKDGTAKKATQVSDTSKTTMTYDKHGRELKEVYSYGSGEYITKGTATYKNKYNKKGHLIKSVKTETYTTPEGQKVTGTETTTVKYKYAKQGHILKESQKTVSNIAGEKNTSTFTITYKYKKFKVAKKYLKFM